MRMMMVMITMMTMNDDDDNNVRTPCTSLSFVPVWQTTQNKDRRKTEGVIRFLKLFVAYWVLVPIHYITLYYITLHYG